MVINMSMKICLSNIIEIIDPTKEILDFVKTNYTYKNPTYDKKRRMGFYLGKTSKTIKLYELYKNHIYLPCGVFDDIWQIHPYKEDYKDYSVCKKINIKSNIVLRDYQKPVPQAVKKYCNGLIIMPCGTGKSCTLLQTACELKQKTLWLCTTKDLLVQAESYIKNFTNGKTSRITEGKCDYSGDFVFATIQTLVKVIERDEIPQDTFGCVIGDEVQHCMVSDESVIQFKTCMEYFSARYKLGCTATLKTSNDLWKCIPKLIGNVIYELKKNDTKDKLIGYYEGKPVVEVPSNMFQVPARITFVKTNYSVMDKDVYDRTGRIMFTKLITDISQEEERNQQILSILHGLDKPTIVISERVDQLHYLSEKTPNSVYIDGKTKKAIREQSIADFKDNKYNVLFASYSLVAEGLDIPQLEYLIMATPVKDERLVIQSIGRCQRPSEGKTLAKVYDLVDNVGMLDRFTAKRRSVYKKEGWEIVK